MVAKTNIEICKLHENTSRGGLQLQCVVFWGIFSGFCPSMVCHMGHTISWCKSRFKTGFLDYDNLPQNNHSACYLAPIAVQFIYHLAMPLGAIYIYICLKSPWKGSKPWTKLGELSGVQTKTKKKPCGSTQNSSFCDPQTTAMSPYIKKIDHYLQPMFSSWFTWVISYCTNHFKGFLLGNIFW